MGRHSTAARGASRWNSRSGRGRSFRGWTRPCRGWTVGEKKVVEVPADEAYGQPHPNARQDVPRADIPDSIPLELGLQLQMQAPGWPAGPGAGGGTDRRDRDARCQSPAGGQGSDIRDRAGVDRIDRPRSAAACACSYRLRRVARPVCGQSGLPQSLLHPPGTVHRPTLAPMPHLMQTCARKRSVCFTAGSSAKRTSAATCYGRSEA